MDLAVAFLAGGRLYIKEGESEARAFESKFAQTVRDRAVRSAQKNAWKTEGAGAQGGGGATVLRIAITGLSRAAQPGLVLYALDTDDIVGLFTLDPATGEEKRLFHSNAQRVRFPSARPGQALVVCSLLMEGGASNLAVMNADGSGLQEITEGESLDLAPSWAPEGARVVYQTAGLGRDRQGRLAGISPFSVQLLDPRTGEIEALLQDARHDFLGPRLAPDGTVYAIRRPYRAAGGSPWRAAADVALFPVRMVSSMFGFRTQIDADQAPALVPASWKLVRRRPGGQPEELASGILSFDLADDGTIVCSNGGAVDVIAADGKRETLWNGELIEQVVAL